MVEGETSGAGDDLTRSSKPGATRLLMTFSVLISFLLAFPFLYASTAIYRSPLPFASIASLSSSLLSRPPTPPCRLRVVFLGSNPEPSAADRLRVSISDDVASRLAGAPPCGGCGSDVAVFVSVVSEEEFGSVDGDDDRVDEFLESVLAGDDDGLGRVYTIVVAPRAEVPARAVVGKHRHAWVVGKLDERDAIDMVGRIFVKYFVNGGGEVGAEAGTEGEFVPVGLDGNLVLSFTLLNADPKDWVYDWGFREIQKSTLDPMLEALAPIANITIESQVLYHTPKLFSSYWDEVLHSYIFNTRDLPFFVNSNEWHLDTSIAAGGRAKVLQFVVYVPSSAECPLHLQISTGGISTTNGFTSPMWGGVVIWNPPKCSSSPESPDTFSSQDVGKIFEVFIGQLRVLFGLRSSNEPVSEIGISNFLNSRRGFAEWELDVLYRRHACLNIKSCVSTLDSLSKLVQSLPRMIVMDEIGKQVELSLDAASAAQNNASLGVYDASAVSSRKARALAEDAFFHPSIMSISYSSNEHYFAIYMPFFAPVTMHVLLAAIKEVKRYRRERMKYFSSLSGAS